MNPLSLLARAFSSNLGAIAVSPEEQTSLANAGITEPTVQRYVVWRRASILMVVAATVLSAVVSTISTYTEPDDQPDLMETISETFLKKIEAFAPGVAGLAKPAEAAEPATAAAAEPANDKSDAEEGADEKKDEDKKHSLGSIVEETMGLLSLYAMPVAALIVLFLGTRFRIAYRVLVATFLFSFFAPMFLNMLPWSLWEAQTPPTTPLEIAKDQAEGLMEGAAVLLSLLPTVLSLIPGVQKACLRVKTLLPQSSLPGWFVIVASPLYGLFLLVIFVAVDQITTQPAILASLALLSLSSLFYVFRPSIFTQPLLTEADLQRMKGATRIAGLLMAAAGLILVVYLLRTEIMGIRVVGTDPEKSLMRPIEVVEFALEIIGRSMFVGVVAAELILRLNLTMWRHNRLVTSSPAAAPYDSAMEATGAIV